MGERIEYECKYLQRRGQLERTTEEVRQNKCSDECICIGSLEEDASSVAQYAVLPILS